MKSRQSEFHMENQTSKNYREKNLKKKGSKKVKALPDVNIHYKVSLVIMYYKALLIKREVE